MPAANTTQAYGSVTRTLHWLTALLILSAFPLGLIAEDMPFGTSEELAAKAQLFSIHKTVGVTVFFVALARILWALTQTKPAALHPDRKAETFAAELVHWLLYISLVVVPLSGWIHHAATEGFAPILWPFGQALPFVPKSPALAELFGTMHWLFTKVLMVTLILHVAGALKHVVVDRDGTFRRMWSGRAPETPVAEGHPARAPMLAAAVIWVAALGAGWALAPGEEAPEGATLAAVDSDWQVTGGSVTFDVTQMGAGITGSFADWTAAITFDPESGLGHVRAEISIPSLTLGSVTAQALGAEFFDAETNPTSVFEGDIRPESEAYVAEGTLTLRGTEAPLSLPFTLSLDGDTADMGGEFTLQRLNFGIGESYSDGSQVGTDITVHVTLSATR